MKKSRLKKCLISVYEYLYEKKRELLINIKYPFKIMSEFETIEYIKKNNCSIARYGDGELSYFLDDNDNMQPGFQSVSNKLVDALSKTLKTNDKKLLICISPYFGKKKNLKILAPGAYSYWSSYRKSTRFKDVLELIKSKTSNKYVFGNAAITRPYIDIQNREYADKMFNQFKELWNNRDIIIIEGSKTRLGVGNDLFSNVNSIKRVIAPAENAFEKIGEIQKEVEKNYNGELILLALGPAATVLAKDFALNNMQALDIGHIDIEYEWFLSGETKKTAIKGKYVNEALDGRIVCDCDDIEYNNQIISIIQ